MKVRSCKNGILLHMRLVIACSQYSKPTAEVVLEYHAAPHQKSCSKRRKDQGLTDLSDFLQAYSTTSNYFRSSIPYKIQIHSCYTTRQERRFMLLRHTPEAHVLK